MLTFLFWGKGNFHCFSGEGWRGVLPQGNPNWRQGWVRSLRARRIRWSFQKGLSLLRSTVRIQAVAPAPSETQLEICADADKEGGKQGPLAGQQRARVASPDPEMADVTFGPEEPYSLGQLAFKSPSQTATLHHHLSTCHVGLLHTWLWLTSGGTHIAGGVGDPREWWAGAAEASGPPGSSFHQEFMVVDEVLKSVSLGEVLKSPGLF